MFKKYRIINPETEFVKEQMELLKKQYLEESSADKFFEATEEINYLREFQEFERPPIIPEEVAQTEFYRPNPAAFQKKINDNPYAVDVGFASLENPIYTKLDNFPALQNTRANTMHYNPTQQDQTRFGSSKPFASKLNAVVIDKLAEADQRGKLDDLVARAGLMNFANSATGLNQTALAKDRSFKFGSYQPPESHVQSQASGGLADGYRRTFDFIRQADDVVIGDS